jgi:hypothetical protein
MEYLMSDYLFLELRRIIVSKYLNMKINTIKIIILAKMILSFYACNNDESKIFFNENKYQ